MQTRVIKVGIVAELIELLVPNWLVNFSFCLRFMSTFDQKASENI